jgi:transcription-repair coupling factor (superfamily II helicase)
VEILKLKFVTKTLGGIQADIYANKIVLGWDEEDTRVDPFLLVKWVEANEDRSRLIPPGKLELRCADNPSISLSMRIFKESLEDLSDTFVKTKEGL